MSKPFERKRLSRGSFSLKCTKYKTLEIICMIYNNEKTILAARYVFQTSLDALDSASFRTYKLQREYRVLGLELSSKFMVVQAITQDLEPSNQRSFVYRIDYERPDSKLCVTRFKFPLLQSAGGKLIQELRTEVPLSSDKPR